MTVSKFDSNATEITIQFHQDIPFNKVMQF